MLQGFGGVSDEPLRGAAANLRLALAIQTNDEGKTAGEGSLSTFFCLDSGSSKVRKQIRRKQRKELLGKKESRAAGALKEKRDGLRK